jgi:hypothetical protein
MVYEILSDEWRKTGSEEDETSTFRGDLPDHQQERRFSSFPEFS